MTMRTPEEIKKALEHCRTGVPCAGCPYLEDEIIDCCKDFTPRPYIPYIDYGCKAAGKSRSEPRRRGIKIEINWERNENQRYDGL